MIEYLKENSIHGNFMIKVIIFSVCYLIFNNIVIFIEDAECELNCKPIGSKFFATFNNTVVDGTLCSRPDVARKHFKGRSICVEGVCKVSDYLYVIYLWFGLYLIRCHQPEIVISANVFTA